MAINKAVLLFGPPGSGKGTQGKALGVLPGYRHIATGDLFRAIDPKSDLAKEVKSYSSRGALAPDDLAIRVWENQTNKWIKEGSYSPGKDIIILDGIPRNYHQALLMKDKINVIKILELYLPNEEVLVQRLKNRAIKEGRDDDAKENVIKHRLKVYHSETESTLKFYDNSIVVRVNADQSVTAVLADIAKSLA